MLKLPDYNRTFILYTDASLIASGAILTQDYDGICHPIAYASKAFTKGERNKPPIELEFLAICFGIKHFAHYLIGVKFLVRTDHKPLVHLFSMKDPNSKLTRIRLDLLEYDFVIEYVKGDSNVCADALSRISVNDLKELHGKVLAVKTRLQSKTNKVNSEIESIVNGSNLKISNIYEALNNCIGT